jgi:hypothetical protein
MRTLQEQSVPQQGEEIPVVSFAIHGWMREVMSKLQWLLVAALAVVAFIIGAPHLNHGYVGYYLSGKCPETTDTTIPQCQPPILGGGGGVVRVTR